MYGYKRSGRIGLRTICPTCGSLMCAKISTPHPRLNISHGRRHVQATFSSPTMPASSAGNRTRDPQLSRPTSYQQLSRPVNLNRTCTCSASLPIVQSYFCVVIKSMATVFDHLNGSGGRILLVKEGELTNTAIVFPSFPR